METLGILYLCGSLSTERCNAFKRQVRVCAGVRLSARGRDGRANAQEGQLRQDFALGVLGS